MNIDNVFNEQDYDSADRDVSVELSECTHTLIIGWGELTNSFIRNSIFGEYDPEKAYNQAVADNVNFWANIEKLEKVIKRLSHLVERCEYEKDIFYVNYPCGIREAKGRSIYLTRIPDEFNFDKDKSNLLLHFKHKWTTVIFKFTPYDDLRTTMAFFQTVFDYNSKVGDFRIQYVDNLHHPSEMTNIKNLIESSFRVTDFGNMFRSSSYVISSVFQEIYHLGFFSLFDEKNDIEEMHKWLERYEKFREKVRFDRASNAFKKVKLPDWWEVDIKPVSLKSDTSALSLPMKYTQAVTITDPTKIFVLQPEKLNELIKYNVEDALMTASIK